MQALLEFLPLLVFIAAYYLKGIYVATGALMASMLLLLAVDWLRQRRIAPMHGISAVLVFIFGSATLALHDQRFIQWKPTIFFWAAAFAFLGSQWLGARTLAERVLGTAMGENVAHLGRSDWRALNLAWVVFYLIMGAANLAVAWNASERFWVNFKVFGITAATFAFVIAQSLWIARRAPAAQGTA
jgi:intracellular septation protein